MFQSFTKYFCQSIFATTCSNTDGLDAFLNTRTSRNEQNETALEEQINLIAEKLTKKLNEEN